MSSALLLDRVQRTFPTLISFVGDIPKVKLSN